MAKKVDSSFNFLGIDPRLNVGDPNVVKTAVDRSINSDPVLFNAYHTKELVRPRLDEIRRQNEMERLRNVDVNSFNYLAKKAGYDEGYAASLFNRVQDLSSMETQEALATYSDLLGELNDLKEQATTEQFGGIDKLADFGEGFFETAKGLTNLTNSLFGGEAQFTDPSEYLGKNKNDVMAQKALDEVFTPTEIYNYAKRVLDRQHKQISIKKFSQENGGADKILSLIESKNRDLTSMNGFDDLILPVLNNQFTTPGSDYFRGEGGDMTAQDVREFQDYTKQLFTTDLTKRSSWGSHIGNDGIGYGKYDLEKEALNDYKSVLQEELFTVVDERRGLIDQDKLKKNSKEDLVYQGKITRLNSALDKLVSREKNIDQVYGVSVGDRSGFLRGTLGSAYMATRDFATFITPGFDSPKFDIETQLLRNAMYKPEVVKYDKYGNPVLSNQVFYETASGNKANWSGLFEAGGAMIGDMTPAILTGGFVARAVGAGLSLAATEAAEATFAARAVSSTAKAYDKVNRYGNLRLADRVSTFGTIYGSTKPRIYEQEKKWGGDAEGRATYLAIAEAAAESIGFPDVGMLKVTPYSRGLGAAARTATGVNLTRSQLAGAYLRGGAEFAKNAVKANLVESFEEEMSLLGETLVSQAYADEYAKAGREQTEFSAENIVDTFVESFKGGLLYSGLMTGQNHYRATRKDALLDQAEYEAALNPELFKAKLKEIHQKNPAELSEKQLADGIVTIDNLSNTFKGLSQLENLRDLNTFFEDEESRRRLFTAARQRDVLRSIDFDSLTPEQQEEFTKAKLSGKIAKNATKEYNKVRQQIANLVTETQGKKLTPEESIQLIALQAQAFKLKEVTNTIDLRKLNNSQMETLASMGIIQDKDFQFTQEDLDKMIGEVDTEILKTEKRAFEYASMSKAEKAEAIKKAYEKKIAEINQVDEPNVLMESLIKLKRDYEYLEKNVPNINPEILANKQALLDAFEQKFDSLTQRDEFGNNAFEAKLRELDVDKAITDYNIEDLVKLSRQLNFNKEHINEDLAELLGDQVSQAQAQIIENLNKLTGDAKVQALAKILDQTIKQNTITYFDKASFLKFLTYDKKFYDAQTNKLTRTETVSAAVSDEEFEKVRAEVIRQRGLRKSASMSTTGSVDNVSAPVDSQFQEDALRTMAKQAATASNQTDEDGTSPRSVLEKQYADSFLAGKTPAESVAALKDRIGQLLNAGSARATTLLNAFNNLLTSKDTVAFDSQLASLKAALKAEADSLRSKDRNSKAAQALDGVIAELGLWQNTAKKLLILNPATDFAPLVNITPPPVTPEVPPVVDLEEDDNTLTPNQIKSKQEEINKLDEVQKRRRSRLLDLTSPVRSNGIELDPKDQINQDPVVKRRVAFINDLASTPDAKIKIFNKKQFLREFLASKYPNKTSVEIEQDLKTIETFFAQLPKTTVDNWLTLENQAEILTPITDLLGTEFLDKGQVNYYVANKGAGLVTTPEVIMTAADNNGKIILKDGYPLELSFVADNNTGNNSKFADVPWKLSGRIQDESDNLTIKQGDVIDTHKQTFADKKAVKAYLEKNDTSIMGPFEISEGVLVTKGATSTTIADLENNPQLQSASIRDFALPTQKGTLIAGKQFKYNVGRLYYDNNGNPVLLGNNKLDTDEILAIAEIIYSSEEVIDPSELDAALFDLVNQINKDSKLVFFPTEPLMNTEGQYVYPQLLSPSKVTINEKGERKYKKLSKEEFIEEMKNSYYKASAAYLEGGTKFNQKITRFGMQNGKPVTYPQPYLEFIKETHTIPVNSEGEIVPLVNKIVYPSPSIFEEAKKTFKLSEDTKSQPPSKGSVSAKSNPVPPKNTKKSTDPAKTPVPNDVFNMIPFSELPAFLESLGLGALIPTYSEDTYNALLAEIQSNPSFTPFVFTKDGQGVMRSDYVGNNPQASFLRAAITLNGKTYFVYFRPGSHTTGVNIGAVMTEGNVSFTTQIPQPTQTQTLPEVPTTTGGKLENVRFQNKDYKVELVQQEDGTFQVANIFNPDGKSIPLQTATGISVMMLLDDEALGKKDTGFMSVNDLMNAANQTPQRPSAPSKPAPKTPTNTVFTEDESQQAKENKDSCAKGLGEVPSFKKINNQVPTGNRIRKK
jgi:hypothetical protein